MPGEKRLSQLPKLHWHTYSDSFFAIPSESWTVFHSTQSLVRVDMDIFHGTSTNLLPLLCDHDLSPIHPTGPSIIPRPWESHGTPMGERAGLKYSKFRTIQLALR